MTKISKEARAALADRTKLVYAGRDPSDHYGFVNTPIYRGSTVLSPSMEVLLARTGRFTYGTQGTPTSRSLETAWSEIAGAAGTVCVPSGLAAVSVALLSCLKAGDHLLITDSVYRPTRVFADGLLKRFGVETTYYDPTIGAGIEALFRPNTKAVFTEAPGSQTFEMQDITAIAEVTHRHGATLLMDNTWATPFFFPPHAMGVDLAIEAGTKYLSGHSDLLLGMVSANEKAWPDLHATYSAMAICAGPEDMFLALRGMRTMLLRLKEQEKSALLMAEWLKARPEVSRVLHPALPDCPGHDIWKRDFKGSSGLFSIVLKPASQKAVAAMLDDLALFGMGYSWGGFESLIIPFDAKPYRTATAWQPEGPALRIQIGLEDVADLQKDLDAGFARLRATT
jgi:cysteine-S-conjugate beta-lyase